MEPVKYRHISDEYCAKLDQIEYLSNKFLKFIPRKIPDYPSHGADHSESIIDLFNDLIDNWQIELSEKEVYLLYLAAWLHDIGNIVGRNDHHKKSVDIINNTRFFESILEKEIIVPLEWVILAHSSSFSIEDVPNELAKVRLRLISSIFRILDACEIVCLKCPSEVYMFIEGTIEPKSKEYWMAHMNIINVYFKNPNTIKILLVEEDKSQILITHLEEEIKSVEDVLVSNEITSPHIDIEISGL